MQKRSRKAQGDGRPGAVDFCYDAPMRLHSPRFILMAAALAVFSLPPVAHAAEVSSALQVDTSPGLSPEAVKRVFDQQRQTLAACTRLLTEVTTEATPPWNPPADTDDRILLRFEVGRDGKVRNGEREEERPRVEGLYLATDCAGRVVSTWTFPSFPALKGEKVRVEIRARFSTTAAERKAELAQLRDELEGLCKALSPVDGSKPTKKQDVKEALQRYRADRRSGPPPRMQSFVDALPDFADIRMGEFFTNGSTEILGSPLPCPKLQGWVHPNWP